MPFQIIHNDLTKMDTDAIVNAANSRLAMGGGVCGAIFHAAGAKQLQAECNLIGGCPVGEAVITQGYNLPAKKIIHTVGPVWNGGNNNEKQYLQNAYRNSLQLAVDNKLKSISFPLISSGIYGYPKEEALAVAVSTITEFLMEHELDVYLVVFNRDAVTLSGKLFSDIQSYIDENYIEEYPYDKGRRIQPFESYQEMPVCASTCVQDGSIDDLLTNMEMSFSDKLISFIDEKGLEDAYVYKKANFDRKLFSKIKNNKDYTPKKLTVLSFAIALKLTLDETEELLETAGYSLSMSSKEDVIIKYYIERNIYDIYMINQTLFSYELGQLGSTAK